jgi:hypothetical protein
MKKHSPLVILTLFVYVLSSVNPAFACWFQATEDGPQITGSPSGKSQKDGNTTRLDPVYINNGDFVYRHAELSIPCRGLNINIAHTYKSQASVNGQFGSMWDFSYNKRINDLQGGNAEYLDGEGNRYVFTYVDGTQYTPPAGLFLTLVANADGTWTLTKKDGTKYAFDQRGLLSEIEHSGVVTGVDSEGNAIEITSKWGQDPLYKHHPRDPEALKNYGTDRIYYRKNSGKDCSK